MWAACVEVFDSIWQVGAEAKCVHLLVVRVRRNAVGDAEVRIRLKTVLAKTWTQQGRKGEN